MAAPPWKVQGLSSVCSIILLSQRYPVVQLPSPIKWPFLTRHDNLQNEYKCSPNSHKGLYPFHVFGNGVGLSLSLSYATITPKSFTVVPGPWILCGFTAHLLCCRWLSKACTVFCSGGKSSHCMSSIHWVSQMLGRKTVTGAVPLSHGAWWGHGSSLEGALRHYTPSRKHVF